MNLFLKFLVCIFFISSSILTLNAQNVEIRGKILADSLAGSAVNIVNLNSRYGTTNDKDGNFKIRVALNDSLIFSAVQFISTTIKITAEIIESEYLEIFLESQINTLDQVNIPTLSGYLSSDLSNLKIQDKYALNAPMSTATPLTHEEKLLFTATTGPGGSKFKWYGILLGSVPIDPIINHFSGRTKMLKMLNTKIKDNKILDFELEVRYDFFINELKIPEHLLHRFLEYCYVQEDYKSLVKALDKLALLRFYKSSAIQFFTFYEEERGY